MVMHPQAVLIHSILTKTQILEQTLFFNFNPLKEKFLNASGGSVTLTHGNLRAQEMVIIRK